MKLLEKYAPQAKGYNKNVLFLKTYVNDKFSTYKKER